MARSAEEFEAFSAYQSDASCFTSKTCAPEPSLTVGLPPTQHQSCESSNTSAHNARGGMTGRSSQASWFPQHLLKDGAQPGTKPGEKHQLVCASTSSSGASDGKVLDRLASQEEVAAMVAAAQLHTSPAIAVEEHGRGKRRRIQANYAE